MYSILNFLHILFHVIVKGLIVYNQINTDFSKNFSNTFSNEHPKTFRPIVIETGKYRNLHKHKEINSKLIVLIVQKSMHSDSKF